MTRDEKIDAILSIIYNEKKEHEFEELYMRVTGIKHIDFNRDEIELDKDLVRKKMTDERLIELDSELRLAWIEPYGEEVQEEGGWLNHLKNIHKTIEQNEKERQLQIDLAKSNIRVNELNEKSLKFSRRMMIFGLVFTGIGVIISAINLIIMFMK